MDDILCYNVIKCNVIKIIVFYNAFLNILGTH